MLNPRREILLMAAMFVNKVTRGEMEGQTLGQVNSERKRKLSRLALAPAKLAVLPFQVRFSPLPEAPPDHRLSPLIYRYAFLL